MDITKSSTWVDLQHSRSFLLLRFVDLNRSSSHWLIVSKKSANSSCRPNLVDSVRSTPIIWKWKPYDGDKSKQWNIKPNSLFTFNNLRQHIVEEISQKKCQVFGLKLEIFVSVTYSTRVKQEWWKFRTKFNNFKVTLRQLWKLYYNSWKKYS